MAERVCPVWLGYLLASPLRKLFHNPHKILGPYVKKDMHVLDIGCAMGFFSLPIARIVGPNGKVTCVDIQKKMLMSLEKRAHKAGLAGRIETRLCYPDSFGLDNLDGRIDFALAFAVVHEVPEAAALFFAIRKTMAPMGRALVAEPKGHVSRKDFDISITLAEQSGLEVVERREVKRCHAVLLARK